MLLRLQAQLFGVDESKLFVIGIIIGVVLSILILIKMYANGPSCEIRRFLHGKYVLITGANSGIGKETAYELARRGAYVIMACRDIEKGKKARAEIKRKVPSADIVIKHLDLASKASIDRFVYEFREVYSRLDILINNAATGFSRKRETTEDGFELAFGTNHLGHFYLTYKLMSLLEDSSPSRVINVSSKIAFTAKMNWDDLQSERNYNLAEAYNQSKLANILHAKELARRYEFPNVRTCSVHPGVSLTELSSISFRNFWVKIFYYPLYPILWLITKSVNKAAQTTVHCALIEHIALSSGGIYQDCRQVYLKDCEAEDPVAGRRLWKESLRLLGLPDDEPDLEP